MATFLPTFLRVDEWDSFEVRSLCLDVVESYEQVSPDAGFAPMLDGIGGAFDDDVAVPVVRDGCDARLGVTVTGRPLSAGYSSGGILFTGVEVDATLTLSAEGHEPLVSSIAVTEPPPDSLVLWEGDALPYEPQDAPFWRSVQSDLCASLAGWFGPASRGGVVAELLHNVMHNRAWTSTSCGGYGP